ncbi:hypothetical protein Ciccas_012640, partial [Cichlidogyrus casuarinus]
MHGKQILLQWIDEGKMEEVLPHLMINRQNLFMRRRTLSMVTKASPPSSLFSHLFKRLGPGPEMMCSELASEARSVQSDQEQGIQQATTQKLNEETLNQTLELGFHPANVHSSKHSAMAFFEPSFMNQKMFIDLADIVSHMSEEEGVSDPLPGESLQLPPALQVFPEEVDADMLSRKKNTLLSPVAETTNTSTIIASASETSKHTTTTEEEEENTD